MTINNILDQALSKLSKNKNLDSSHLDAEVLLAFVLKKDRTFILSRLDKELNNIQINKFKNLIKSRLAGWPVAYLVGKKEFFGLDLKVNKDVLIPRPETETLVELVFEYIENVRSHKTEIQEPLRILDLGTGSGCIIISIAHSCESRNLKKDPASSAGWEYFASDISKKALAVARYNAKKHKVKIKFKQGDLLKPWQDKHFDIIVANLPYLAKKVDPSTKYEPKQALIARKKGLALIEKLFKQIAHLRGVRPSHSTGFARSGRMTGSFDRTTKRPPAGQRGPKYIFVEFDPRQKNKIKKLADKLLPASPTGEPNYQIKFYKDLKGSWRFALLTLVQKSF